MSSPNSLSAAQVALARAQAQRAKQQYQQAQALTVSPGQLIILLYEGALRFLRQGQAALEECQTETAHTALCRAQDILRELDGSLDERAGVVSENLHRLYDYCLRRLVAANTTKDPAPVAEVIEHIDGLLAVWRQAVTQVESSGNQGMPAIAKAS